MRTRVHSSARPARLAAAGLVVGCSQLDTGKVWPWSISKSEKPQPGRMTVVWTHATEIESNREMRGFRGRIFFFPKEKSTGQAKQPDKDRDQPIKVEGTLTVYAFDVTAKGKLSPIVPRKFLFEPEKFKKQCSESKQGPSYQVWLPWDTVGGPPKQVNLWTRFDGINQGAVVMSDHSPQLLPGVSQMPGVSQVAARVKPLPRQPTVTESPQGPIRQAGYETSTEAADRPASGNHSETGTPAAATADWWK
jgi:hypothetical protein